jgi:hypothetical protein
VVFQFGCGFLYRIRNSFAILSTSARIAAARSGGCFEALTCGKRRTSFHLSAFDKFWYSRIRSNMGTLSPDFNVRFFGVGFRAFHRQFGNHSFEFMHKGTRRSRAPHTFG